MSDRQLRPPTRPQPLSASGTPPHPPGAHTSLHEPLAAIHPPCLAVFKLLGRKHITSCGCWEEAAGGEGGASLHRPGRVPSADRSKQTSRKTSRKSHAETGRKRHFYSAGRHPWPDWNRRLGGVGAGARRGACAGAPLLLDFSVPLAFLAHPHPSSARAPLSQRPSYYTPLPIPLSHFST